MYKPLGSALVSTHPPTAHMVATGELDVATSANLIALLSQAVADGCRDFRVDMAGVTFCDASTIGLLVGLDRRVRADGGSLTLVSPATCVLRLLDILDLKDAFGELEHGHGRSLGERSPVEHLA
jgi:anti-sigma B factor antagonist